MFVFMITYILCSSCFHEIWAICVSWITYDHLYYAWLPQSHCGDKWEGTLFSWEHIILGYFFSRTNHRGPKKNVSWILWVIRIQHGKNGEYPLGHSNHLPWLGMHLSQNDLEACHCLNKKETVIIKYECEKHKCRVLVDRKNFQNKSKICVN